MFLFTVIPTDFLGCLGYEGVLRREGESGFGVLRRASEGCFTDEKSAVSSGHQLRRALRCNA